MHTAASTSPPDLGRVLGQVCGGHVGVQGKDMFWRPLADGG